MHPRCEFALTLASTRLPVCRSLQHACNCNRTRLRPHARRRIADDGEITRANCNLFISRVSRPSLSTIVLSVTPWCNAFIMGSTDTTAKLLNDNYEIDEYGTNLKILPSNNQVKELQTILRDKNTTRSDFKFYADRLIRLVVEESLNQLPFTKCVVTTPTGAKYKGLKYQKGNCGVSIVRSGEAMEQGLRDCCRSIRIGKILVESDMDTHEARVVYAKFPDDISERKVLLMYPIMSTGNTVIKAITVLKEHNVLEENIILSNLFCTPIAAKSLVTAFPKMKILTSEIHTVAPNHFGQKYFGCTRVVVETSNIQEKDN